MKKVIIPLLFVLFAGQIHSQEKKELSVFAESKNQWTGIAISKKDRVFVNFPRWSNETPISVAEIIEGKIIPYPNKAWNNWDSTILREHQFICVQSVYIDNLNTIWILDTGYELKTDATKGAHLYAFDLTDNSLKTEYVFPESIITNKSYLNDLQIDNQNQIAYFTDSDVGGIVLLDLRTREIRRVLSKHPSTLTEVSKIVIEGLERTHAVHSDGIALDPDKKYLYYCALMGKNIYRIPTKELLDKKLNDSQLGEKVEKFAETGANDGIIFDKKGNLYLSSLEKNAISKLDNKGALREIISDKQIKWPDSFAFDSAGNLLFTISKIHLPKENRGLYSVFRLSKNQLD
jgi:sugar lactone lactonase YvrE